MHRLAWHNAERNESELHDSLVLALLDSGETVMLQDWNRDYIFVANLPDVWKLPADSHPTDENLFGNDLSARLAELKKDMHTAGSRGMLEVNAGNDRVFQFQVHSTFNQTDQVVMKTTIREVTAERRREQLLRSLLREVSHRSKNLLAIIQSLAGQTARFSLTKDDFLRKFRGGCTLLPKVRISSRIQTGGVRVYSSLLRQQFDLYVPEYPNLIHMEGENLLLNPNGALYIGLAFHEPGCQHRQP